MRWLPLLLIVGCASFNPYEKVPRKEWIEPLVKKQIAINKEVSTPATARALNDSSELLKRLVAQSQVDEETITRCAADLREARADKDTNAEYAGKYRGARNTLIGLLFLFIIYVGIRIKMKVSSGGIL